MQNIKRIVIIVVIEAFVLIGFAACGWFDFRPNGNNTTTTTSINGTTTSTTYGGTTTTTIEGSTAVTFVSAVQTGGTSGTADSTGLTLTFSIDPTTLAASDIAVTGATKGALSGTGTTRTLAISNITVANGGDVTIDITSPSGFTLTGSPQTAVVYKDIMPGVSYRDLVSITGGNYTQTDGTNSFSHTISDFSMGKYEVTYELWYTVYQWAISNGYNFANAGTEGNDGTEGAAPTTAKYEPATTINWRDAIVWCNAYSEMSGYTPCYKYSSATIKDSSDDNATACDNTVCNWTANGYRLPTEGEWQYAASNKGATLYNYASGATTYHNDTADANPSNGIFDGKDANDLVAVYGSYWDGSSWQTTGVTKTAVVGTKTANTLGICDMSGNVFEWCWDWDGSYPAGPETDYRGASSGSSRILRGGSWSYSAFYLQVGYRSDGKPSNVYHYVGFRIARTN